MTSKPDIDAERLIHPPLVDICHKLPPLKALTPLRVFAAAYVFLFHIRLQDHLTTLPIAARFVQSGYTGVTFFFLLSGFVLAYNYPSVPNAKSFWFARFSRIYPVYLLATVLMLLLNIRQAGVRHLPSFYGESLLVLAMLQAWWPRFAMFLNAAAWTLSVEAFLYAVFPFLAVRFPRLRWRTFLLFELAYLLLVCLPWLMALMPKLSSHSAALADLLEGTIPLVRLNPFLIGIYLGARWRDAGGGLLCARTPVSIWCWAL